MGFFDKIKNELIDIIEWLNEPGDVLVHRFERHQNEIKMGAKLIVRPGQKAVFVNEGEIADVFEPGTHELETQNLPVLSTLKGWMHGFNSPFKAEVYFIDTTEQLDRKWGTQNPIMMRDADFGVVRLRCRGNYSYKINDSAGMISRFTGAASEFKCSQLEGQIRAKVVSSFSDCVGELKIPALDLAAQYDEIGDAMKEKLTDTFDKLGLVIIAFTLENITLPEEVQKAMDERASMGALGDLNKYSQFQSAKALREAAKNEGMAGQMMGMMVGGQLAGSMGGVLKQDQSSSQGNQANVNTTPCAKCNSQNPVNSKFCGSCGEKLGVAGKKPCIKCKKDMDIDAKFCGECGAPQEQKCSKCDAVLEAGTKFCSECGTAQ